MLGPRSKLTKLVIRLLAIFIGALLTILIAVPLLGPCWHLLHGDAISFGGWRVPVPKGFYARKSETATVMWKQSLGIPFFNVPYGHISLFRPPSRYFHLIETMVDSRVSLSKTPARRDIGSDQSALSPLAINPLTAWSSNAHHLMPVHS
jgi:hypothetical protein